jgi:hypothetical protein
MMGMFALVLLITLCGLLLAVGIAAVYLVMRDRER